MGIGWAQPTPVQAVVLADNLANPTAGGLIVGEGIATSSPWQAMKFNTTSASIIRSITTTLRKFSATDSGDAIFDIYSDNGNQPGSVISASASVQNYSSLQTTFSQLTSSGLSISLSPNTTYWLVGRSSGATTFEWSSTSNATYGLSAPPVRARSADGGSTWITGFSSYTQLRIEADEVPGPLPALGASAAFGWSRRLRRRVKSAALPPLGASRPS